MTYDPWLPVGFTLPDGNRTARVQSEGANWQIVNLQSSGRCLLAKDQLHAKWHEDGLVEAGTLGDFELGSEKVCYATSGRDQTLCQISEASVVRTKSEALAFASALRESRKIGEDFGFHDAIYFEKISRLLPTYSVSPYLSDEEVLGYWLTGGANISATSVRRLDQAMAWLNITQIREVIDYAGIQPVEVIPNEAAKLEKENVGDSNYTTNASRSDDWKNSLVKFELPGRPELASFFNEHVIDVIRNQERYRAFGIDFPSAAILHGPPGCGKTFAVEKLVEFLGWPNYQIDASSVASPYIHETSRKVAQVFQKAMDSAPSVLVIDEMEAFLSDRDMGTGHHRVEEVAEFLRRIPEAVSKNVLLIAMTNRIDMIDPAIQRRGRFDHVIQVDFANKEEIKELLDNLLRSLPTASDVMVEELASKLFGRPLSDVSFVVREAARLTAKSGESELDQRILLTALKSAKAREREGEKEKRKAGFI